MKWPINLIVECKSIYREINCKNITPSLKQVMSIFKIKPKNIKIVIVGQDPYPKKGIANGRAFAVSKNAKIPQSLKNIFNEIRKIYGEIHTDQTLDLWVKQGILLLNKSLTTEINFSNSHKKYWDDFIKKLIIWIDVNIKPTWVLWGNEAKKIQNLLKSKVINDAHPSPLSVRNRNEKTFKILNQIKW